MKFAVCYNGLDVFNSTEDLIKFYKLCAAGSDPNSSEHSRYVNILMDFMDNPDAEVGLDGDGEDIWEINFHDGNFDHYGFDKVEKIKVDHQNYKEAIEKVKKGAFKLPDSLPESFKGIKEAEEPKKEETLESLIDKIENIGWWVNNESKDGELELEIGMMSDAGEDFFFTATGKDLEELKQDIRDYCWNGFDIDEHVAMWIEAGQSGTNGVPDAVTLVHDAESLSEYLEDLGDRIYESVKNPSDKTAKDFLDYELEDDNSPAGGTAFAGETLRDFIEEVGIPEDTQIEMVNKELKINGIKPIEVVKNESLKESKSNPDRTLAEDMSLQISDLFRNMAEDLNNNDQSLYDWLSAGESFGNSGEYSEEEIKVLEKMMEELNPKIQEVTKILLDYQK